MLSFFRSSPRGLKRSRRALGDLANAIRRLDRQRDTRGILPRVRYRLGAINRELNSYETKVSEGEGKRAAAGGLCLGVSLLAYEIKQFEREIRAERELRHLSKSPFAPLYGPLENLKTVCRQLMYGPETAFQRLLNKLIRKSDVTPYALAIFLNGDPGFIYKLMKGERRKPSRDSVTRIATALMECSDKLSEKDANRLLHSAGYLPLKR